MNKQILIIGFFALLILPFLVQIGGLEVAFYPNKENRKLAKAPRLADSAWTDQSSRWFHDHYGMRIAYCQIFSMFKYYGLHVAPFPQKGYVGKDGYLFLGNKKYTQLVFGIQTHHDEKWKKYGNYFSQIKDQIEKTNTSFYLAIAPNKHRKCADFLPDYIDSESLKEKRELVKQYLRDKAKIKIIDLSEGVSCEESFTKSDAHWNQVGAFQGTQNLIKALKKDFPQLQIPKRSNYQKDSLWRVGDISRLLNLPQQEFFYQLKALKHAHVKDLADNYEPPRSFPLDPDLYEQRFLNQDEPNQLKIMFCHDSFIYNMMPFINAHFRDMIYIRNFERDYSRIIRFVSAEKPDVFVLEITENALMSAF